MSRKRTRGYRLLLTDRAIQDIREIERYSIEQWGKRTATKYISDIEAGLQRINENPELLREVPDFHVWLRFYRINKHVLVSDAQRDAIFMLTLIHGTMDIPSRLSELKPTLAKEVEMLHQKLHKKE